MNNEMKIDSNPDPESLMCRIHEKMVQADLFEIAMISRARIDPTFSTAVDAMILSTRQQMNLKHEATE